MRSVKITDSCDRCGESIERRLPLVSRCRASDVLATEISNGWGAFEGGPMNSGMVEAKSYIFCPVCLLRVLDVLKPLLSKEVKP